MPSQRVVTGRLDQLVELATQHQISSPALIIVGEVVSLRQTCDWFNRDIQITSSLNHDRNPQLRIKSAI